MATMVRFRVGNKHFYEDHFMQVRGVKAAADQAVRLLNIDTAPGESLSVTLLAGENIREAVAAVLVRRRVQKRADTYLFI